MFLRNVGQLSTDYAALYSIINNSSELRTKHCCNRNMMGKYTYTVWKRYKGQNKIMQIDVSVCLPLEPQMITGHVT
jgi:hypothetical protein